MARIPVFPSFWPIGTPPPAAPVTGTTAPQDTITVTPLPADAGGVPVASSSKPRHRKGKQRNPASTHDHVNAEAGPSMGGLVVQQWDPITQYRDSGETTRKRRKLTDNTEATQRRGKRSGK
jgi:hypothetical protein